MKTHFSRLFVWAVCLLSIYSSLYAQSTTVGAIPGEFSVNPLGAATYTIPIECPEGLNGMTPSLSLVYNSHADDGMFGIGWSLGGLSAISRNVKTEFSNHTVGGINFDYDDAYALDGNPLVCISGTYGKPNSVYHTEMETYQKIMANGSISEYGYDTGPEWFKVTTKAGVVMEYGRTSDARFVPSKSGIAAKAPYIWSLNRMEDANGNYISYKYDSSSGYKAPVLIKVIYGNTGSSLVTEINIFPGSKMYYKESMVNGRKVGNNLYYSMITVKNNGQLLYTYVFDYNTNEAKKFQLTKVMKYMADNSAVPATIFRWEPDRTDLQETASSVNRIEGEPISFITNDVDGDGKDDLMVICKLNEDTYKCWHYRNYSSDGNSAIFWPYRDVELSSGPIPFEYYSNPNMLLGDFNGDGVKELALTSFFKLHDEIYNFKVSIISPDFPNPLDRQWGIGNAEFPPAFACGDLNNDGYDDMVHFENVPINGQYRGYIHYYYPNPSVGSKKPVCEPISIYIDIAEPPKSLYISDFNADGLNDLLIVTDVECYFYINKGGSGIEKGIRTVSFSRCSRILSSYFDHRAARVRCGDFNGDGIMDFLVNHRSDDPNWYMLISTGSFDFQSYLIPQIRAVEENYTASNDNKEDVIVFDFNHDGKDDIIIVDAVYSKHTYVQTNLQWLRFKNIYEGFEEVKYQTIYDANYYRKGRAMVGDFNADGRQDMFVYLSSLYTGNDKTKSYLTTCFNSTFSEDKITSVTDGMNRQTTIGYRPLSYPQNDFYKKTGNVAKDKYLNIQLPLYCVSESKYGDADGTHTISSQKYQYKDLRFGVKKKNVLGFAWMRNTEAVTGHSTSLETLWNYLYCLPDTTIKQMADASYKTFYKETHTFRLSNNNGIYCQLPYESFIVDSLKNNNSRASYTYDGFGNLTQHYTVCDEMREIQSMNYVQVNSWCPNKISRSGKKRYLGSESVTRFVLYEYDAKGNLVKETRDPGDVNELVTQYSNFNKFGLPQITGVTGNGVTRTQACTYSSSGRFIVSKTNELRETTTYNWNENSGLLNSQTDDTGTTNYLYDSWRRMSQMTTPDGIKTQYGVTLAGNSGPSDAYYCKTEITDGASPVTKWYDCFDRELRSEVYGLNGKKVWVDKEYDEKGRIASVTQPYFNTDSPLMEESYTYDEYGRPATLTTPWGTTTYSYNGRTTNVTSPLERRITLVDGEGKALEQTVNGKKVSYSYYASGLLKSALPEGGEPVEMEYDLQGNRTKLIDPDGGILTSEYNAFGQLVQERQLVDRYFTPTPIPNQVESTSSGPVAVGEVITNYTYTSTGLLSLKECKRMTKVETRQFYTYDNRNRIHSIDLLNGDNELQHEKVFYYDGFNRVTSIEEQIGNERTLVFNKEYDSFGRISVEEFPSGYKKLYMYDDYGYLIGVGGSGLRSNFGFWSAMEANARGQYLHEQGPLDTYYTYNDRGQVTRIRCDGIMDMSYYYDSNGRLSIRSDLRNAQQERYFYDGNNRLQRWRIGVGTIPAKDCSIYYDEVTGTIQRKSDVGYNFFYGANNNRSHALTSIDGRPPVVSSLAQTIKYTSSKKVKEISEGNKKRLLTYGIDGALCKELVRNETGDVDTHYYSEDYEEIYPAVGLSRKIHYIYGPEKLGGVHIYMGDVGKSRVINDPTIRPEYFIPAFTDAQGSLIALYNMTLDSLELFAYDPWGRRRDPLNWSAFDSRSKFTIDRGYCMHQHWDDFKLINMGARVYDPVFAQFLSPDPYIQAPDNWLNYNRYAYCLNNPLMYTDPTGEFFLSYTAGFFKGLFTGKNPFKTGWKSLVNEWKITKGLFKGKFSQIVSRFTWELPQTIMGNMWSHFRNYIGKVDEVRYVDGGTFVVNENASSRKGMTLGNYININIKTSLKHERYKDENGKFTILNDPLFMHEYGHYMQSQIYGLGYLFGVAIPSIISATQQNAEYQKYEKDASRKGHDFFNPSDWNYMDYPM